MRIPKVSAVYRGQKMIRSKRNREEAALRKVEDTSNSKKTMVTAKTTFENYDGVIKVELNVPSKDNADSDTKKLMMNNVLVIEKEAKTILRPLVKEETNVDGNGINIDKGKKETEEEAGMFWEELELSDWESKQDQSLWKTRDWEWIWYPYWDDITNNHDNWGPKEDDQETAWEGDLWQFTPLPNSKLVPSL